MRSKFIVISLILIVALSACTEAQSTAVVQSDETVDTGDGAFSIYQPPEGTATPVPTATPPVFEASDPATCSVVSTDSADIIPEANSDDWSIGPEDAPVTIIVYEDFQCSYCLQFTQSMETVWEAYPDQIRFVFRHYPLLSTHLNAGVALIAAEAAGLQDSFWEMHDLLFETQNEWAGLSEDEAVSYFVNLASQLDLDTIQFELDMGDQALADILEESYSAAVEIGIPGTPMILINGDVYSTSLSADDIMAKIESELNQSQLVVTEDDWVIGPMDAPVTLVQYTDLQCTYCAQFEGILNQLAKDFPEELRIVFRHFPLEVHTNAILAAQATEAAGLQDKFWEMKDYLFENQVDWMELENNAFYGYLGTAADDLELDAELFYEDLESDAVVEKVSSDYEIGLDLGIQGPPAVYIDGEVYDSLMDYNSMYTIVNLMMLDDIQFDECPPMTIDPEKEYYATMVTEKGDIVFQLFPDVAPMTVNNFIFLAENDWYDNTTFHRVLYGYLAQGGDPTGTGYGSPGFAYDNEVTPELMFDREGLLAMANAGPTSNGSQFFITHDNPDLIQLSGSYTIFGIVIEGMDVVYSLTERNPDAATETLPPGDMILDIIIEER